MSMSVETVSQIANLVPGDVLSYSAGSTQTGPDGFRKLRPATGSPRKPSRGRMLDVAASRWPELLEFLGDDSILFINAYPASVGTFDFGITVDTYLSPRVLTRALQLGRVAGHPTILLGQPLFVADALLRHVAAGHSLPETLMIWVGGYTMPRALERMLETSIAPHVDELLIIQYFGAAEVDAGCLVARDRNADGELIYLPRDDVRVEVDGERLLLTLLAPDGTPIIERFATGDLARSCRDGWTIRNPKRLHPRVEAALESWSESDWRRRTGYVRRDGDTIWIQLREGESPRIDEPTELGFFEFASRFSFSWLDKPTWR